MSRALVAGLICLLIHAVSAEPGEPPNDPDFFNQWALSNQGQLIQGEPGAPGTDVSAIAAWEAFEPSVAVVVAIVGSGVNPHPEFADRLLEGHVTSLAGGDPYSTLETVDIGTRVAGIIAAARNNGVGIAGLNDRAWILPVRALNGASGTPASVAEGIEWAVDAGASVIVVPVQFYNGADVLAPALEYAAANDVVVIAPSGQDGDSAVAFPAGLEHCLAAASTDARDAAATFSNYGPQVDLAAPSVGIWSTSADGGYGFEDAGRSAWGAAHVAGVASLIRSQAPVLERSVVEDILLRSTDDDAAEPGWDPHRGWGRLNAERALAKTLRPDLRFEHESPATALIDPNGPTWFFARIVDGAEQVASGTVALGYRLSGETSDHVLPMQPLGDAYFGVLVPPIGCETTVEYFFRAQGNRGSWVADPFGAPNRRYAVRAVRYASLLNDDFEGDQGWTSLVEGGATRGAWVRGVPIGTSAQPAYDFSPDFGRFCFFTGQNPGGNESTEDVDGGPVRLLSPSIRLTDSDVEVSYARWFHSQHGSTDALIVELSRDDGIHWVLAEAITATTPWETHTFRVGDFPSAVGDTLRLRFTTSDLENGSLTEAAIDEVRVRGIECSVTRGDVDGDGDVDLSDAREWGGCLTGPVQFLLADRCRRTDADSDAHVDLRDLQQLQNALGGA